VIEHARLDPGRGRQHPQLRRQRARRAQRPPAAGHHPYPGALRAAAGDRAIKRDFPQVSVDLQAAGDAEVLDLLAHDGRHGADQHRRQRAVRAGWRCRCTAGAGCCWCPRSIRWPLRPRAGLAELARHPLISYESSTRADSSLQRAFAAAGVEPQIAMTARDANLIKTYVRAGLGVGLLAEMAVGRARTDLRASPAPAEIPECITWAVLPRGRVLREYALACCTALAPQLDRRDLRRVLEGNQDQSRPTGPLISGIRESKGTEYIQTTARFRRVPAVADYSTRKGGWWASPPCS
jgi:DNA-binding transcriptional LysR family regulator